MKPLPISADTAVKLSQVLSVPIEQLIHMPQPILMKKLAELAAAAEKEPAEPAADSDGEHSP